MDTYIQKANNRIKWSKKFTDKNNNKQQGDIFTTIYTQTKSIPLQSTLTNISNIRKSLTTNQCIEFPSDNDIIIILMSNNIFKQNFLALSEVPLSSPPEYSEKKIKRSCQTIMYCLGMDKTQSIQNDKELNDCKQNIYRHYSIQKSLGWWYATLPLSHSKDSIFFDGDISNSAFDILQDIEDIKSILFEKRQEPDLPQMIYYSMPSVIMPSQNNTNNNWWINTPGNINSSSNSFLNNNNHDDTAGLPTENNSGNTDNTIWWQQKDNALDSTVNNFLQTIEEDQNNHQSLWSTNWPTATIQEPLCITSEQWSNISLGDITDQFGDIEDLTNEFNQLQWNLFQQLSWMLYHNWWTNEWLGGILSPGWFPWTNNEIHTDDTESTNTSQQCNAQCATKEKSIERQICEWTCCIQTCQTLGSSSEKAVCISQCLCGEWSTKNDELRIKFCQVPAQVSRVIAGKRIFSIEEAVKELNTIFTKLKTNWLLIKRAKTKEALDSSFRDIKLSKILSFDIFIAIKPIYDKISRTVETNISKKELEYVKISLHPTGVKINSKDHKSRYVIVGDHPKILSKKSPSIDTSDAISNRNSQAQKLCTERGFSYSIATQSCKAIIDTDSILKTQSYINYSINTNDEIYSFIKNNSVLRDQIAEHFNTMLQTASALQQKAENAQ